MEACLVDFSIMQQPRQLSETFMRSKMRMLAKCKHNKCIQA